MGNNGKMSRKEACFFLGIREDATEEEVKRAYRYKAKLYHPDANPSVNTEDYYIKVQKAYEYLSSNPYTLPASSQPPKRNMAGAATSGNASMAASMPFYYASAQPQRPVKIFSTNDKTRARYQQQKVNEKEREKIQKWEHDYRNNKKKQKQTQMYGKEYAEYTMGHEKSKEEEVLEKIRAIWLAETIKRQIAQDKEKREAKQRKKLYRAFMHREAHKKDAD